jgi:hypothetical protein
VFYHKSCLCFTTNRFFVLPQIVSLFYHKSFLCFTTNHFFVLPPMISCFAANHLKMYDFQWVSDCCLLPTQQFLTIYISMRWLLSPLWTRPTLFVEIIIVLAHWSNNLQVGMSLRLNTLSWFKANQSLLLLLNAACLAKKQQIPISIFGLTRPCLNTMLYYTLQVPHYHYTIWCSHITFRQNNLINFFYKLLICHILSNWVPVSCFYFD